MHNCCLYAHNNGLIKMGNNVSINSNVILGAADNGEIVIGNDVLIGPNVVIRASNHQYSQKDIPIFKQGHTGGRIVNISSIVAKYGGSANSLAYGCSKRALEGLTKILAREGAGYNILVNTIRPGVIDTVFHRKFPKDMDKRIAMIPVKRMGRPMDVAGMVYFLGSEKNNFITNQVVTVSGGE